MKDLLEHIKEEESDDLPALEKAIATAESESLAKSFERTKAFVPSRSHPSAPSSSRTRPSAPIQARSRSLKLLTLRGEF
jgi:hypothetical protein